MNEKINIFQYSDAGGFLKATFDSRKERNPLFSLRSWAKNLGIKNSSALSHMINSKRSIPSKYVYTFIKNLKLVDQEIHYFEQLIELSKSKTTDEYNYHLKRLDQVRPSEFSDKTIILEEFELLANPLSGFILELCMLKKIANNASKIKQYLYFGYTVFEVKRIIQQLLNSGLLVLSSDGYLERNYDHLYSTIDKKDMMLRKYHASLASLAKSAVIDIDVDKKEYNAVTINIQKNDIQDIKSYLRRCLQDYIKRFESEKYSGDFTCQLNLNWFLIGENA